MSAPTIQPAFHAWFRARRADWEAVVFDVDGVLILGGKPIRGAMAFVDDLRAAGTPFGLLTNDGNHSIEEKNGFLRGAGYTFADDEIVSCSHGLVEAAAALGLAGQRVFVAGDLGVPSYAAAAGLRPTGDLAALPDCAALIMGEGQFDWQRVFDAMLNALIARPTLPFLVPNPDEFFPSRTGGVHIAAGGTARFIVRALDAYGLPIEPLYLGKPYRPIFAHNHAAMERRAGRRLRPERVLMIGDSLASDVRGGRDFGYRTALLLTGVTRDHHLPGADVQPDFVFAGY